MIQPNTSKKLSQLLNLLGGSMSETLASLINKELQVNPGETRVVDKESLVDGLKGSHVVAMGSLDKDYAGKSMSVMFENEDAITMAGLLMMTPDEVIEQNRQSGDIEGGDLEAFGELGNVLFSGIGTTLRDNIESIDIRLEKHALVKPGNDSDDVIAEGSLIEHSFSIKVGDYPESTGYLIVDRATAETWNGEPLVAVEGNDETGQNVPATGDRGDDDLAGIPEAPIRGKLAAFIAQPTVYRLLRQSCRRVGLELLRHGKGEIPNPAAHRQETVVIDVPAGESRQFDWCKRIKEFASETKVVLLLHHPSRSCVTRAFLSRADTIIGLPCEEQQLSERLSAILESDTPAPQE